MCDALTRASALGRFGVTRRRVPARWRLAPPSTASSRARASPSSAASSRCRSISTRARAPRSPIPRAGSSRTTSTRRARTRSSSRSRARRRRRARPIVLGVGVGAARRRRAIRVQRRVLRARAIGGGVDALGRRGRAGRAPARAVGDGDAARALAEDERAHGVGGGAATAACGSDALDAYAPGELTNSPYATDVEAFLTRRVGRFLDADERLIERHCRARGRHERVGDGGVVRGRAVSRVVAGRTRCTRRRWRDSDARRRRGTRRAWR